MNKWLTEIEIASSNHFGQDKAREFIRDTRPLVDSIYESLKRNVRSRYGKIAVILWPQSVIEKDAGMLPPFEYDTYSGVCMINIPYPLDDYFAETSKAKKEARVLKILKSALESAPDEVGLEKELIINIIDKVSGVKD